MNNPRQKLRSTTLTLALMMFGACGGTTGSGGDENEVITTLLLTFTPMGGGTPIVATANDPDGDTGQPLVVEPVNLPAGMYGLTLRFENRLESPPEDITIEIRDEGDQHQIFFTGTAVNGPASNQTGAPLAQTYADMDTNGLPIGLANTVTASAGSGTMTVTLRHMPPVNGVATKAANAAETVRSSGFSTLGGATDVQINFPVMVGS